MKISKFIILILFISFSSQNFAQVPQKKIHGIITDNESNLEIPFVKLILKRDSVNPGIQSYSNLEGFFSFSNLELGTYNLLFQAIGFDTVFVQDIKVEKDTIISLRLSLRKTAEPEPIIVNKSKLKMWEAFEVSGSRENLKLEFSEPISSVSKSQSEYLFTLGNQIGAFSTLSNADLIPPLKQGILDGDLSEAYFSLIEVFQCFNLLGDYP